MHKELLETIRSVHAGKRALSAETSMQLDEHATDDALTPAEIRVLRLIAEGNANKEIAAQLSVSEETVKGQVRNVLSKIGRQRPYSRRHVLGAVAGILLLGGLWTPIAGVLVAIVKYGRSDRSPAPERHNSF